MPIYHSDLKQDELQEVEDSPKVPASRCLYYWQVEDHIISPNSLLIRNPPPPIWEQEEPAIILY
jgi:hypothetical protein